MNETYVQHCIENMVDGGEWWMVVNGMNEIVFKRGSETDMCIEVQKIELTGKYKLKSLWSIIYYCRRMKT